MPSKKPTHSTAWLVRGVAEEAKHLIRVHAAQNRVSIGEAIAQLVTAGSDHSEAVRKAKGKK